MSRAPMSGSEPAASNGRGLFLWRAARQHRATRQVGSCARPVLRGPKVGRMQRVAAKDYRFSSLVLEIVNSLPFRMRRGEPVK